MALYDSITYLHQKYAAQNTFRTLTPSFDPIPSFQSIKGVLPNPRWDSNQNAIDAYWKTWELTFAHVKPNSEILNFAGPYLDTFFNGNLFLWDSVFALQFCRYGERAFDFSKTIDTFYRKQHTDGFICRELSQKDGKDTFERFDPCSTGPNVFPWYEERRFQHTGDIKRIEKVFDALMAYHIWLRLYRSWPDGSYWYTGWGGGLDNQLRHTFDWAQLIGKDAEIQRIWFHHGFVSWVEATALQYHSAKVLVNFAKLINRETEIKDLEKEMVVLEDILLNKMWNNQLSYFTDILPDGTLSSLKSVVSYWLLFTGLVFGEKLERFVQHITDPKGFNTPHMIPAITADSPLFDASGDYWNGGVWPPTSYMVTQALHAAERSDLASLVGKNHHFNTVECFKTTGTVWENYSPSGPYPGKQSKPDNIGWSGLGPVALLIEEVFGIRSDYRQKQVIWNIELQDSFSLTNYPFGLEGIMSFSYSGKGDNKIEIISSEPLELVLIRNGKQQKIQIYKDIPYRG